MSNTDELQLHKNNWQQQQRAFQEQILKLNWEKARLQQQRQRAVDMVNDLSQHVKYLEAELKMSDNFRAETNNEFNKQQSLHNVYNTQWNTQCWEQIKNLQAQLADVGARISKLQTENNNWQRQNREREELKWQWRNKRNKQNTNEEVRWRRVDNSQTGNQRRHQRLNRRGENNHNQRRIHSKRDKHNKWQGRHAQNKYGDNKYPDRHGDRNKWRGPSKDNARQRKTKNDRAPGNTAKVGNAPSNMSEIVGAKQIRSDIESAQTNMARAVFFPLTDVEIENVPFNFLRQYKRRLLRQYIQQRFGIAIPHLVS